MLCFLPPLFDMLCSADHGLNFVTIVAIILTATAIGTTILPLHHCPGPYLRVPIYWTSLSPTPRAVAHAHPPVFSVSLPHWLANPLATHPIRRNPSPLQVDDPLSLQSWVRGSCDSDSQYNRGSPVTGGEGAWNQ